MIRQASQAEVGQAFPEAYIELVTDGCAADDDCAVLSASEYFGKGRCVLVGMPGAFTPTCTDEHLPGYIRGARKFKRLGVKTLAVVTTNDRFIMTAWKSAMKQCVQAEGKATIDNDVAMLADPDADLTKALGLAFNMELDRKGPNAFFQLNAGIRAKRFALIVNDGVIEHIAVDEGTTDLDATSADSILAVLGDTSGVGEAGEQDLAVPALALGGAVAAFFAFDSVSDSFASAFGGS